MSRRSSVGALAGSAKRAPGANSSRNFPPARMSSAASNVRAKVSQSRMAPMHRSLPRAGEWDPGQRRASTKQPVENIGVGRVRVHGDDEAAAWMVGEHDPPIGYRHPGVVEP